jgi:pimeloyl-ACP methyl ester carboxylesterase
MLKSKSKIQNHKFEFRISDLAFGILTVLLAGCLAPDQTTVSYGVPALPQPAPTGVVFVANGAGDFRTVSRNLSEVISETKSPLQMETFVWSRGYRRYVADQIDHTNHLEQGQLLAAQVAAYRNAFPQRRTYLIGHSAGCAVVLAAAEHLSPDSLNRVILLAPSVSTSYDLRPALRTALDGIEVFHSEDDVFVLGFGIGLVGTADGASTVAAGQAGFSPIIQSPSDAVLYQRLHQHPWGEAVNWSGNSGGHFGNHETTYLRAYVLPLLLQ